MRQNVNSVIPASYLVLFENGKILLLRRFNTGYEDGKYSLVAGHVEPGESFSNCIIREAKEEAGITISEEDIEVIHVMYRNIEGETSQRIEVFYTAKNWSGKVTNMEQNKCDDLSWFDLNNIPLNTIGYIREALLNIGKGLSFSEFGWSK